MTYVEKLMANIRREEQIKCEERVNVLSREIERLAKEVERLSE